MNKETGCYCCLETKSQCHITPILSLSSSNNPNKVYFRCLVCGFDLSKLHLKIVESCETKEKERSP